MGTPYSAQYLGQGTAQVRTRRSLPPCLIRAWRAPSLDAFANMAPILLFTVYLGDRRSRQGVFALRAPISLQPCALRRDSYYGSKARAYVTKVSKIMIKAEPTQCTPTSKMGYVHQPILYVR